MAGETPTTKKLFLRLDSSGVIALDTEYMWDGCDTPEIDPEIELTPVPVRKLTDLLAKLYLDTADKDDSGRLRITLSELKASCDILEKAITEIEAKFPT